MIRCLVLRDMRSQLSAARVMLGDAIVDEDDLIGHLQYPGLVRRLEDEVRAVEASSNGRGELILDFAAGALHGTFGVDLSMANRALDSFKRLIAKQVSALAQDRASRRTKTYFNAPASLVVTSSPRGFILREAPLNEAHPPSGVPTAIRRLIEIIGTLVDSSMVGPDLARTVDKRVLKELTVFFGILDDAKASFWLMDDGGEVSAHAEAVRQGRNRLVEYGEFSLGGSASQQHHRVHRQGQRAQHHP